MISFQFKMVAAVVFNWFAESAQDWEVLDSIQFKDSKGKNNLSFDAWGDIRLKKVQSGSKMYLLTTKV